MTLCPSCGHSFEEAPSLFALPVPKGKYTAEFEAFWSAFPHSANASKSDAFKAWNQVAKMRPPLETLLRCVAAYEAEINSRLIARPTSLVAICHASTWLRGQRWEGYMSAVALPGPGGQMAADNAPVPSWAIFLAEAIGEPAFHYWFKDAEFSPGPPPVIRVEKMLNRDRISTKYCHILDRCLGDGVTVELKACAKSETGIA